MSEKEPLLSHEPIASPIYPSSQLPGYTRTTKKGIIVKSASTAWAGTKTLLGVQSSDGDGKVGSSYIQDFDSTVASISHRDNSPLRLVSCYLC